MGQLKTLLDVSQTRAEQKRAEKFKQQAPDRVARFLVDAASGAAGGLSPLKGETQDVSPADVVEKAAALFLRDAQLGPQSQLSLAEAAPWQSKRLRLLGRGGGRRRWKGGGYSSTTAQLSADYFAAVFEICETSRTVKAWKARIRRMIVQEEGKLENHEDRGKKRAKGAGGKIIDRLREKPAEDLSMEDREKLAKHDKAEKARLRTAAPLVPILQSVQDTWGTVFAETEETEEGATFRGEARNPWRHRPRGVDVELLNELLAYGNERLHEVAHTHLLSFPYSAVLDTVTIVAQVAGSRVSSARLLPESSPDVPVLYVPVYAAVPAKIDWASWGQTLNRATFVEERFKRMKAGTMSTNGEAFLKATEGRRRRSAGNKMDDHRRHRDRKQSRRPYQLPPTLIPNDQPHQKLLRLRD